MYGQLSTSYQDTDLSLHQRQVSHVFLGRQTKKRPLLLQLQILLYNVGTSLIAFHAVYMAVLTFSVSCYSRFFPSNQSDLFKESGHCETGLLTPVIKQIQHHLWKADTDVKPIFFSNHA